jgi:hypothetical protein
LIEDPLKVSGLAAEPCTVIHDLAVDFPGGKVNKAHALGSPFPRTRIPTSGAYSFHSIGAPSAYSNWGQAPWRLDATGVLAI